MTLEGAKRALRGDRSQEPETDVNMELLERLQSLRSMLLAVRESLDEQPEIEPKPKQPAQTQEIVEPNVVAQAEQEQVAEVAAPKPAYREQTLFDW